MDQSFTLVRRGYSPEEVDVYTNQLQGLINQRNQELAAYKEKENAINSSVIDAKMLAKRLVDEANEEAAQIIAQAKEEAERTLNESRNAAAIYRQESEAEMAQITERVNAMRHKLDTFQLEYSQIVQQYLVSMRANELTALVDDLDDFMRKMGIKPEEEAVSISDLAVGSAKDSL